MRFDCIIANPPYAKIGCDITKKVIENNPDSNYAMLGTRSMFKPLYEDTLACQFVQIGRYEFGSNKKLDWGVEQAILLATNGWTQVIDNRKRKDRQPFQEGVSVGTNYMDIRMAVHLRVRTSHLVGMGIGAINPQAYTDLRTATLVAVGKQKAHQCGFNDYRTSTLTDKNNATLRNGYIYVSFDTFEEACECAIDIVSWKNPTDSHHRCVRWGFVVGLVSHERYKEEGEQK